MSPLVVLFLGLGYFCSLQSLFVSFSWAAEVPGIMHCPPKILLVWLLFSLSGTRQGLCFSWSCCAPALLESVPLTPHPSTCRHVSKCTEAVAVWPMSALWEGGKVLIM